MIEKVPPPFLVSEAPEPAELMYMPGPAKPVPKVHHVAKLGEPSVYPDSVYGLATGFQLGPEQATGVKLMTAGCAIAALGPARAIESTARGLASERKEYRMDQTPGVVGSAPSAITMTCITSAMPVIETANLPVNNEANTFADAALHAARLERRRQARTRRIVVSVLQYGALMQQMVIAAI